MAKGPKIVELVFPRGGLYERVGFQSQTPYFTPDCLNVRPDDKILGRERGGSRPGLAKAFSGGLGGAVRLLHTIRYVDDEVLKSRLVASAGGSLWQENDAGSMASVVTTTTLVSDRRLYAADYQQNLYIADWDVKASEGTDGEMTAGTNEVQTVTASGSTFTLSFTQDGKTQTTAAIDSDAEAYTVQERLEALDLIGQSNVAVGGSAGSYTVTFQGALSGRNVGSLTGSGASVATTTTGAPGQFSDSAPNSTDYVLVVTECTDSKNLKVMVTVNGNATSGGWKLNFLGGYTPLIDWDATAHRVKQALATIENVELDDVDVLGDDGGPFIIEIKGQYAGQDISPPLGSADRLKGGAKRHVTVRVLQKGGPIGTHQITSSGQVGATGAGTGCTYYIQRGPKKFSPDSGTLAIWVAAEGKGFVPTGCPLICRYRDRLVLAGAAESPHQWYMSRQGDPNDWDYSQEDVGAAVSGQVSEASEVGEMITALIPHADECLVIGCRTSIWIVRGDPAQGGHIDNISQEIGILSQGGWCFTPNGELVFLSADGVYVLAAGCGAGRPVSLSREFVPERLLNVDPDETTISLAYDVRDRGVHVYLTESGSSETIHYWIDWEEKGFWPQTYQSTHEPTCVIARRDVTSDYSEVMIGGGDGYIRRHQEDIEIDDGDYPIPSYVVYGPILLAESRAMQYEGLLTELSGTLARNSGPVRWELRAGNAVETAYNAAFGAAGAWHHDGLNTRDRPRLRGAAAFLKVMAGSETREWSVEHITAVIQPAGQRRC